MRAVGGAFVLAAVTGAYLGCANDGGTALAPLIPQTTASSSSSSSSSGAGGGGTGAGGGSAQGPSAQDYFKTDLYPLLALACGACHGQGSIGPQFLGPNADKAYANIKAFSAIVTDPKKSRLLTKGKHAGPALTAEEATRSTTWLQLELKIDPMPNQPPVELTPVQQLEKFGKCIKKADWDATNVHRLYKMTATSQNNQVPCASCHGGGVNGTYIDANSAMMLAATQKLPFILKFASATLTEDGTFSDIAFSNRWVEKGAEGCPPIGNCHPKFKLDAQLTADINTLFTKTYDRWLADDCAEAPAPPQK